MPPPIRVPRVVWALGDREKVTTGTDATKTITEVRPLYYHPPGSDKPVRVGSIDPDYAEPLMQRLLRGGRDRRERT